MVAAKYPKLQPLAPYNPYGVLPDDLLPIINQIAGKIAREFGHSDPNDLAQEAWLWIGAHPRQSAKWWYLHECGDQRFSYYYFRKNVASICATVARKDKARALGYKVDDEVFYKAKMVERYLPYVWTSDVLASVQDVQEGPSAKGDPSLGGDAMVAAMDVRRAYAAVISAGSNWEKALFGSFAIGYSQQEMADEMGVTQQTVSRYVLDAVHAMAVFLNGTEGFRKDELPHGTLGDGLGSRKVVSNASAVAAVRMSA